jgi:hypothetical protein
VESRSEQDSNTEDVSVPMSSPRVLRLRDYRRPEPDGVLLSLAEACARLGVEAQVIYALKHHGRLHTVQDGGWQKYLSWEVDLLKTTNLKDGIFRQPYLNRVIAQYESAAVLVA